jgi:hypothetical protein
MEHIFKFNKQKGIVNGKGLQRTDVMKSTIFWDIMPCRPLRVNQHFGGTYHFHLWGRKMSQQETSTKAGGKLRLFFDPEDGGDIFLRNVG